MSSSFIFSQSKINISGFVYDEYAYPVPYSSIGIIKKNIGASSTEEGSFSFFITKNELGDILEISSIGYSTIFPLVVAFSCRHICNVKFIAVLICMSVL